MIAACNIFPAGYTPNCMKPAPLYLSYPGNYGMILRTLLPEESGGDGEPLDVVVLSPAVPKGTVLQARLAPV